MGSERHRWQGPRRIVVCGEGGYFVFVNSKMGMADSWSGLSGRGGGVKMENGDKGVSVRRE